MGLGEWVNPVAIAIFVLAVATVALIIASFRSIKENRLLRTKEQETTFHRCRITEVQRWITDVLTLLDKSVRALGNPAHERQRAALLANRVYVKLEVQRLDSEFSVQPRLADQIGRPFFILEHENLGSASISDELETKCMEALEAISEPKAKLRL